MPEDLPHPVALALGSLTAMVGEGTRRLAGVEAALTELRVELEPLAKEHRRVPDEVAAATAEVERLRAELRITQADLLNARAELDARPTPIVRIAAAFGDALRAFLRGYTPARAAMLAAVVVAVAFGTRLVFLVGPETANTVVLEVGRAAARWISAPPPATPTEMVPPSEPSQ